MSRSTLRASAWRRVAPAVIALFLGVLAAGVLLSAADRGIRVTDLRREGPDRVWRIYWSATAGAEYQLQRAAGDVLPAGGNVIWVPITTVRAANDVAFAEDPTGALARQRFYRVVQVRPSFRIIDIVQIEAGQSMRIRWESIPGNSYQLQRPASPGPLNLAPVQWVPLATVYATGEVASAVDPTAGQVPERFYRVAWLTQTDGDVTPPLVALTGALIAASNGSPQLKLLLTATDNVAVTEVIVREGPIDLGQATQIEGSNWVFQVPIEPGAIHARFFSATARDQAGNQGECGPVGFMVLDPDVFAPVGTDGLPLNGQALVATDSNHVGPFIYRPGGRQLPGSAFDFFLSFPQGATFSETNGQPCLEFTDVRAEFGRGSPLQFAAPLTKTGGVLKQLAVGPLAFSDLATLFDRDPTSGLEVTLFGKLPLVWRGGYVADGGLRAPRFGLGGSLSMALPDLSADYPEFQLNFLRGEVLGLPFNGEFLLPDSSSTPPTVRLSEQNPLWLTLASDGRLSLNGRVQLVLPNNGLLRAQARFDDPIYEFILMADHLDQAALRLLANDLPEVGAGCVPTQADATQLDAARDCLLKLAAAYWEFSAAAVASGSGAQSLFGGAPTIPPTPFCAQATTLEAWSRSALASTLGARPLDPLQDLIGQYRQSLDGSSDLAAALEYWLAFLRTRQAVQLGRFIGSAEALAQLDSALAEAEAVAVELMRRSDLQLDLGSLRESLGLLVEGSVLRQSLGLSPGELLGNASTELVQRFIRSHAQALGIRSGVFTPETNPAINTLERATAGTNLRELIAFLGDAGRLGVPLTGLPVGESLGQLASQLFTATQADLAAAEQQGDGLAFLGALVDITDLARYRLLSFFPNVPPLAPLPDRSDLDDYILRFNTVWQQELLRPEGQRSLRRYAVDMVALLNVLRVAPGTATFDEESFSRLLQGTEDLLNTALTNVISQPSVAQWLTLLEAGNAQSELARRVGSTLPISWEATRLPQVVSRLAQACSRQNGWSELQRAVELLLQAADQMAQLNDHTRRKIYLEQTASLLSASRSVALALWRSEESQRASSAPGSAADALLPGGLEVDDAAGSLRLNRCTGELEGTLRGTLRLPQFDGTLTIAEAGLTSGGEFDLTAYGRLVFPTNQALVTVTVPSSAPMQIRYSAAEGIEFSGTATFTLSNGIYFNASVSLLDPIYSFGIVAGGLEFDLLKSWLPQVPAVPTQTQYNEGDLEVWNEFYTSLAAALGPVNESNTPLQARQAASGQGAAPLFRGLDTIEAYADLLLVQVLMGDAPDPSEIKGPLTEILANLGDAVARSERDFAEFLALSEGQPEVLHQTLSTPPETPVAASGRMPRILQVDVGTPAVLYDSFGPGHEDDLIPQDYLSWNAAVDDVSSGLLWGDGSSAEGVSLDFGRLLWSDFGRLENDPSVINWDFTPEPFLMPDEGDRWGIFSTSLMRDGVYSGDLGETEGSFMAVRVGGLGPGTYVVYIMDAGYYYAPYRRWVWAGKISQGTVSLRRHELPPDGELRRIWTYDKNYASIAVYLDDPSDELLILSRPSLDYDYHRGKLQAFQIVEVEPVIELFSATPTKIDLGQSSTLKWRVPFAERVTIAPQPGEVAPLGTNRVWPQFTTRYVLTAENSSGRAQATVTVTVDGPERQYANLLKGVADMSRIYKAIGQSLSSVAAATLRDPEAYIDTGTMQNQLDRAYGIYRGIKANPQATRDLKTVGLVAETGLNLQVAYESTGSEAPPNALGEVIDFHDQARLQFEEKWGFNPASGQVNPAVVGQSTAEESKGIVNKLWDLAASGESMGSEKDRNQLLMQAHLDNFRAKLSESLRFDPQTGNVNLTGKSEVDLEKASDAIVYHRTMVAAGSFENPVPDAVLRQVGTNLQDQALETLRRLPAANWQQRFRSLQNLAQGNALMLLAGQPEPRFSAEIHVEAKQVAEQMVTSAGTASRLTPLEVKVLDFIMQYLLDGDLDDLYRQRIQQALQAIQPLLAQPWPDSRLKQGVPLLNELVDLHFFIKAMDREGIPINIAANLLPSVQIPQLATRFRELAAAKSDLKAMATFLKALTEASKKSGIAIPTAELAGVGIRAPSAADPLAALLLLEANSSLRTAASVAAGQLDAVQQASSGIIPWDLGLPGNLKVAKVFGGVYYNRDTGYWRGSFGGRLEFPDLDAFFEVTNAVIASDGSFSIDAGTGTPLPFGSVHLSAGLSLTSSPSGAFNVHGHGQLLVPAGVSTQVFDVNLAYDHTERRLAFDTEMQNLDLRLTDDFVLFDAGFGFDVTAAAPEGALRVNGSAGIWARQRPLPVTLHATNFQLVVHNLSTAFHYASNGCDLVLSNGTLQLPEFFLGGDCPGAPPGSGPAIGLSPARPLQVHYVTDNGQGQPDVALTGAIHLTNVAVQVPGLEGLGAELCAATLMFEPDGIPLLTNLAGSLQIPLPPGQTSRVEVAHGSWKLNGLPRGEIAFLGDLPLIENTNGFDFRLRGLALTNCPGARFSVTEASAGADPAFALEGAIEVTLPADMLTDVNGDRVRALACGRMEVSPTSLRVQLDAVEAAGTFHLGGLEGVLVTNAHLRVTNLTSLFDPTAAQLVGAEISGGLRLPNGITGTLTRGGFVFERRNGQVALHELQGSGQVVMPNGGPTFSVGLAYLAATHMFSFDSGASNLVLRLADDFVLFDAGLGFTLSQGAGSGQVRASGAAGLFAKQAPLPAQPRGTNFHLHIDQVRTAITLAPGLATLTLSNGTIHLPEFFSAGLCSDAPQPWTGPQVLLTPASPLQVTVNTAGSGSASLVGAVDFRNFGFRLPGLTDLAFEVCWARLIFPPGAMPILDNFTARLTLPLPNQTNVITILGQRWQLDGLPEGGGIALEEPLRIVDLPGCAIDFQAGAELRFISTNDAGGQRHTVFLATGGLKGQFDPTLLYDPAADAAFGFATTGRFQWETGQLPAFELESLTFSGRIKLGGSGGVELIGVDANGVPDPAGMASITLSNVTHLFAGRLTPDQPFEILVSGALGSAEFVYFGLENAGLRFDGQAPEPEFTIESIGFREGTALKLLGQDLLPLRLTSGSMAFIDPNRPLDQLFEPTNLRLTVSGVVDISLTEPDPNNPQPGGLPRLYGAVSNVVVTLPEGFSGPPHFSVAAFMLTLENLSIGDMAGLSGGLGVGGLDSPNPEDLFFAGMVGGGFNGVGIKAIVALKLTGLLGLCLDVNAGPAGIPLDGGAVGGILLSGAQGGVSFANQFADPCDFKAYLGLGDNGQPAAGGSSSLTGTKSLRWSSSKASQLSVLTWAELDRHQQLHNQLKALPATGWDPEVQTAVKSLGVTTSVAPLELAASGSGTDTNCPTGDCPPATMNLLCQWHPSKGEAPSVENYAGKYSGHVIFKFSSLDPDTVDQILAMASIDVGGNAREVGNRFAQATTNFISSLIPRPPDTVPGASEIIQAINNGLAAVEVLVSDAVAAALDPANLDGRSPLEALYETAYAGVKCVNVTIQLKGTFTYAPISVALSATGGAVASTTGSAGLLGSVNLFGIPVGTAELFYSVTDTNGNLSPSLCGGARAGIGPLDLGHLGLSLRCDGCLTGQLQALKGFIQGLTGDVLNQVSPILRVFIRNAAGHRLHPALIQNRPLPDFFGPPGSGALLTTAEQVAVLAGLLNVPELVMCIQTNPGAVGDFNHQALALLGDRVFQLMLAIYNANNPSLRFCGEVEPKLFGFSLTGGAALVGANLFAEKTGLSGDVIFSPSFIMANLPFWLMSGGMPVGAIAPPLDEATMGFAVGLPVINEPLLRLMTTDPAGFASAQLEHLLDKATLTFGYELIPFGLKLADAEGRVMLPTLMNHPDNPAGYWGGSFVPPTDPDRVTLLKAALDAHVLALATWDGKSNNLATILPAFPVLAQRELGRDYFPYGGVVGAGQLLVPKPIYDAPPMADLVAFFAPITDAGQLGSRLQLASRIFNEYILGSTNIGQLVIYVPAPRPPPAFWQLAEQTPQSFVDSITRLDLSALAQNLDLWPGDQFLMQGNVQGQILGLPLGTAEVIADPGRGLLRISGGTAQGWLTNFVSAGVAGEIRTAEYILSTGMNPPPGTTADDLKPEVILADAWQKLNLAMSPLAKEDQKRKALSNAVARITDTLPKASLVVSANLRIPPELANLLSAGSAASFYAFSPRFEPDFPGTGPVAEARRNGGIALEGRINFANYVTIPNAQLGVAVRPTGLPALSGEFDVNRLEVPGLMVGNAHFSFNSDPPVGGTNLAAAGEVQSICFTNPITHEPLLTIRNLTNAGAPIAATFTLLHAPSGPPVPGFALSPSRVDMPMLGPGLVVRIHGATTNAPFAFSSTGSWTGQVSIAGQLALRDWASNEVVRLGSAAGQQFSAELSGTGMEMDRLSITIPSNLQMIVFPNTAYAYTNRFGVGTLLVISRDGTFLVQSQLGTTLNLRGLGFGSISVNASFRLTATNFVVGITNQLSGGALTLFTNGCSMWGSLAVTPTGVSLSGEATVQPFTLGVFLVSGSGGGALQARLDNNGLYLLSGARLRILASGFQQGVDVLTLNAFLVEADGDFSVSGQSGNINMPSFFSVTNGTFSLSRASGVARLRIELPTLTVFPGQYFQTQFAGVFDVLDISSDGRFYTSKSITNLALPAAFRANGRLEVGYEPDSRQAGVGVNTNAINFGTVNYGASSNRVLNVTNTGSGTLFATFSSSLPDVFTAMPFTLSLEPGQVMPVSVRFTPNSTNPVNAVLTLTHNAPGAVCTIPLSGSTRSTPVMCLSSTNLAFGDVAVGTSATRLLRVDNLGLVSLVVTCRLAQLGPFEFSPSQFTVPPGSRALVNVTCAPTDLGAVASTLQFTANDQPAVRPVALSGNGHDSHWYLQDEGAGTLFTMAINTNGVGFAAGVAPGGAGLVLATANSGHSWQAVSAGGATTLRAGALAEDGANGVLAGELGRVFTTYNSGRSWAPSATTPVDATVDWRGAAFMPGTTRHVLVGSSTTRNSNYVAVSSDRVGNSYSFYAEPLTNGRFNAVTIAKVGSLSVGLLGADHGRLLQSFNGGLTWITAVRLAGAGNIQGVALHPNRMALCVTDSGLIYQSPDNGNSWAQVSTGKGQLQSVAFSGGDVAFAVNLQGEIYRSADYGFGFTEWSREESSLGALYTVAATSTRAWCAGDLAEIYHRPSYPLNRGILTYTPTELYYGFVPGGDSRPLVLTLHNRGWGLLSISGLSVSGGSPGEYSVSPAPSFTIPAHGSQQVNVFYNPSGTNLISSATLQIVSTDPDGAKAVYLYGRTAVRGWVLKPSLPMSTGHAALDVQMLSDTVGYALNSASLYKTTDGGRKWDFTKDPPRLDLYAMHFLDQNRGFVCGGLPGRDRPSTSFILRTPDGGMTWETVFLNTNEWPVVNVHFPSSTIGYAVTLYRNTPLPQTPGAIFRTADGGTTWAKQFKVPATLFQGKALYAVSPSELFVSHGPILYRSTDSAASWTAVWTNGTADINCISFETSEHGAFVGNQGSTRYTLSGGDVPSEWWAATGLPAYNLNSVHFVDTYVGWTTPTANAPAAAIYRTDKGGGDWREELGESPWAGPGHLIPTVVSGRNYTNAVALGTDGCVRLYEYFTNELVGIAIVPPLLDLGAAPVGSALSSAFTLRNAGDRSLTVSGFLVDGVAGYNNGFKVLTPVPFTVLVGGSYNITVVASNLAAGVATAELDLLSDGAAARVTVGLRSTGMAPPEVVVFQTDPPGLQLRVDGVIRSAPVAYTIRTGATEAYEWEPGGAHTIEALASTNLNGQEMLFAGWLPFVDRVWTYTAELSSETYTASYVIGTPATGGAPPPGGTSTNGLPTGPYLRLSNASLFNTNAWLGSFSAAGSALLCATNIEAALTTTSMRIPTNTSVAALAEISGSSWQFKYSGGQVLLKTFAPSLKLLGNAVFPPASLNLYFNNNGSFRSDFLLNRGWSVAPGLLEFGSSSLVLAYTNFFSLASTGEVRALRKPDGSDWAFKANLNLAFRDGPFTNSLALPASILRLVMPVANTEFLEVRGGANSRFEVWRNNNNVFSARLTNVVLEVMGQPVNTNSFLVDTSGQLTWSSSPPASAFGLGPFQWTPIGTSTFYWNIKNGSLSFTLAGGTLKASGVPGWPTDGYTFPSMTFDSKGDFEQTVLLPSFKFDEISLGANGYAIFRRQNGVLSMRLRGTSQFFDSTMSLGFDINGDGTVSGYFRGSFSVDFGWPIGVIDFFNIYLTYNSAEPYYQFQLPRVRVMGNDFSIQFGSGGGRVCHLICGDSDCTETLCLSTP